MKSSVNENFIQQQFFIDATAVNNHRLLCQISTVNKRIKTAAKWRKKAGKSTG